MLLCAIPDALREAVTQKILSRFAPAFAAVLALLTVLTGPAPLHAASTAAPTASVLPAGRTGKVLLVDDDESDNNNIPGDTRLSTSDTFYRSLLKTQGMPFDTVSVPRYKSGPAAAAMRPYTLIIWYTGASYGGNPDNTSVISLDDEMSIQQYLSATGGTVVLVSPGYMSNALGANVDSHWANATSTFLTKVIGVKGARGLLGRFEAGRVTDTAGNTFTVTKSSTVETQFSAVNPDTATVLFTAPLNPDGKGARPTPVAVSNTAGGGRMIYVGFSLENVAPDAPTAFGSLLSSPSPASARTAQPVTPSSPVAAPRTSRTATSAILKVTGTGPPPPPPPRVATSVALKVTGTHPPPPPPPRTTTSVALTVTGMAAPP